MNATTEQTQTPEDRADHAGQAIRDTMKRLVEQDGLDLGQVLSGAHAEIVSAMVRSYGGKVTAERCLHAARVVSQLPSAAEVCADAMPTAGRC